SRRRHTRSYGDWSSDVCSSDLGLMWGISFFGPDVWVQRKTDQRQHEIAVRLPDVLDLLVISVEAGLGFEQAIDRTVDAVPGALRSEERRVGIGGEAAGRRGVDA